MNRDFNLFRSLRSEDGAVSTEAVLMFPLLIWAWIAMFTFFEGLRETNINQKASYTIGDMLSRETNEIDMTYLEGMRDVFDWMTRTQKPVEMRVTVVRWNEESGQHDLIWSRGVGGPGDLTQTAFTSKITPQMPILADASSAIVVETWAHFEPVLDIGLTPTTIYNLVVTPPRFADQLVLEGVDDGTGSTHSDGLTDGSTT